MSLHVSKKVGSTGLKEAAVILGKGGWTRPHLLRTWMSASWVLAPGTVLPTHPKS